MASAYTIEPRCKGARGGWEICSPHRATRWVVLRHGKTLEAFTKKSSAEAFQRYAQKKEQPGGHGYKLGRRMGPKQ